MVLGSVDDQRFYADASYGDWSDKKSTEGAVWFFAGAPIIWNSRKQCISAPFCTASEWCALEKPARDAQWLKKIATVLELEGADGPIIVLADHRESSSPESRNCNPGS
ncbi:hypothetical protein PITC_040420 [Penicillium italicum]|uniref:Uncharacterized protein n=1 Tax=Penicillium italicum TaxID=40296 RepID=A0A0A2LDU6_PENIT|nr:hypothetical protein PITC_040420 [Penicillium italicum]